MREDAMDEGASAVPFPAGGRAPERRGTGAAARQALRAPGVAHGGEVAQRERIIDAMIDVAASRGYGWASVARVSRAAGVSSATFYELFSDREACMLEAYRTVAAALRDRADPPAQGAPRTLRAWCERARSAIGDTLALLETDPSGARVLLFEAAAAGVALAGERALTERALARRADALLAATPVRTRVLDLPAVALVGAIRGIVAQRLLAREQIDAGVLAEQLVAWVRSYARSDGVRWSASPAARLAARGGPLPRAVGLAVLPRGRHGLPGAAVSHSQRVRMINATAQVIARKGYAPSSVRDIVAAARVSRAVFYEHFSSKQHALLEAQQLATHSLLDACHAAFEVEQPWPARVWGVLRVLLDQLAAGPELAHLCMLDCYAAGPEATRQAEELPRFFTFFLEEGDSQRCAGGRLPPITSDAVAGAIQHIIRRAVAAGEVSGLPQRLPELAYIALAPFTGASTASKTIERLMASGLRL